MANATMDVGAALQALQRAVDATSTREYEAQRSAAVWRSMYEEQLELAERLQTQVRALEAAAKADCVRPPITSPTASPLLIPHTGKPLAAPLQIPKPLNKPGPGLSPKGQPMLSRSPSIQELLLSEDGDDDGGGVGGAQRLRRLSERTASKESLHTSPSKESLKGLRWQEIQSCVQSAGVGAAAAAAIATAGARAWVGVAASNGAASNGGGGAATHHLPKKVGFKLICHAPLMPDNGLLDDATDSPDDVLEVRNSGRERDGVARTRRPTLHDFVEQGASNKGAAEESDGGGSVSGGLTASQSSGRLTELIGSMHGTYRSLTAAMGSDASLSSTAGEASELGGRKPPKAPGRRDSLGCIVPVGADRELSCSPRSDGGGGGGGWTSSGFPALTGSGGGGRSSPDADNSGNAIELRWTEPPTTVLVVTKPHGGPALEAALETALEILVRQERIQVWVEPSVKQELPRLTNSLHTWDALPFDAPEDAINKPPESLVSKLDLVVTLGGDGTVLWVSNLLGHGPMPPVAAVALGSLGFMTPLPADNLVQCLRGVLRGGFMLTLRHRLHCRIVRAGEHRGRSFDSLPLAAAARPEEWVVMNECTVDRGVSPFLTSLKAYCNDTFITDVQGDGLIVSTPSGSTAYSLAAGGSMVHPQVPCFLFTPICPHSLSFRPLVFPDSVKLRLTVPNDSRATMWASFDGKGRTQLNAGDSVMIRLSPWPMPTICLKDDTGDWFRSVRHNLHFNVRQQQGGATS